MLILFVRRSMREVWGSPLIQVMINHFPIFGSGPTFLNLSDGVGAMALDDGVGAMWSRPWHWPDGFGEMASGQCGEG
jgi:hypothetical protein